jgi:hypothetical protein
MPYAMVPPGYQAVFLGSAVNFQDLGTFAPLEESLDEGALMLVRLDFAEPPSSEVLAQLEQACLDAQVEMWPGYDHIVYADLESSSIYLAWQKGFAWIPIIVGLLVTVVIPPLLGSLVWRIMPQDIKDMISGIVNIGIMLLVVLLMTKIMPSSSTGKEKKKQVKEAKPEQLEEAKV